MIQSIFERDADISLKEFEVDMLKINDEYMRESSLLLISGNLILEGEGAEPQTKGFFSKAVDKIVSAVSRLITSFIEMIGDIFGNKKNITTADFIDSDTGKVTLNHDVTKINQDINKELLKGRKMIQAISRGTKIPDETVASFVDSSADFINKYGKVVLGVGATMVLKNAILSAMNGNKKAMDDSGRDAKNGNPDKKAEEQKMSILNRMSNLVSQSVKVSKEAITSISKNMKKDGGK